jgi:hypothetical protein
MSYSKGFCMRHIYDHNKNKFISSIVASFYCMSADFSSRGHSSLIYLLFCIKVNFPLNKFIYFIVEEQMNFIYWRSILRKMLV